MVNLKRKVLAVAISAFIASAGAFAQKDDKRPPKDPGKIVVKPKGDKPPPNNNQDKNKGDKRGKP